MSRKISLKGEVVLEALAKYPKGDNLSVAKAIYKKNPEVFKDVEEVRSSIRYYRNAAGEKKRKFNKRNDLKTPENKYGLPFSKADDYKPFIIPSKYKKGIILADIHIPYHNDQVLNVVFDYIDKAKDIDFILLNGDIADFYSISHWLRDPRKRDMKGEIEALRTFLLKLREYFPEKKVFYKQGNHEEWWDKYFYQKAPELWELDSMHLHKFLKLEKNDITWIGNKRIIKYHKLFIIHGHEYKQGINNPVSASRGIFLKAKDSVLISHFHQTSENSEATIGDKIITCYSTGCMCDLHPEYSPLNPKWNHGFAEITNDEDFYFVTNKRIIEGRVI